VIVLAALFGTAGCGGTPSSGPGPSAAAPADEPGADGLRTGKWTAVTDPGSGVTAQLAGVAIPKSTPIPGTTNAVDSYQVALARAGAQRLNITPLSNPISDAAGFTYTIAQHMPIHATVTSNQPITVNGHPGADFRFALDGSGHRGVMFGRAVYTSTRSMQVLTMAVEPTTADTESAEQLQSQAAQSLVVP
jgi:hypothetical protein